MTLEMIADASVFLVGATWLIYGAVYVLVGILSKIVDKFCMGMKMVEIVQAVLRMRRQKKAIDK